MQSTDSELTRRAMMATQSEVVTDHSAPSSLVVSRAMTPHFGYEFAKRALDIVAALVLLALISPAFAQSKTEAPVPVRTVPPDYPPDLRREGVSGLVMVKCSIDEQGNVTETTVEKSSNPAFEKPAMEALKKWKFKPAKQDGNPVAIKVSIPIKFVFES